MKPKIVFALYHPKSGREKALEKLLKRHVPTLRRLKLATDRPAVHARSRNGTYAEIFEWVDDSAAARAHEHPKVAALWEPMAKVCTFARFESLPEIKEHFPHFEPVSLGKP